jgi:3-hydroxyacyl-[acyl-carrier-protein] dehydratase
MKNNKDIFRDNLWTLLSYHSTEPDSFIAVVRFNPGDTIFEVHFPGSPVVPGACIVQICTELLSEHLSHPMVLCQAKNIKFIKLINPLHHSEVVFNFELNRSDDGTIGAVISVSKEETVFVRISARFNKV